MVEALGGDVEGVERAVVAAGVGCLLEAVEKGEGGGVGFRTRVEHEGVGEGRFARLGEEGEDAAEDFVRGRPVVLEESVWGACG